MFRFGIDTLGNRCESPDLLDDTDAKLLLAGHQLRQGQAAQAAALFDRVLASRTTVCVNRHGAK